MQPVNQMQGMGFEGYNGLSILCPISTVERKNTMQVNDVLALKIAVAAALVGTLFINYLANKLPINGLSQGDVSDSLPNLFAPAGITFSIWGIIYLMLSVFTVFQFGLGGQTPSANLLGAIRVLFILNALANMAWIFAWHYRKFEISVVLMGAILLTLILIHLELDKITLTTLEKIVFRLPFSLYFAWITVAAVANVTALLVARGWNRFGMTEQSWAVIMLTVAAVIGIVTMLVRRDIAYGLVFIWAYIGILIKHQSFAGFAKKYPLIIRLVMACLVAFAACEIMMVFKVA